VVEGDMARGRRHQGKKTEKVGGKDRTAFEEEDHHLDHPLAENILEVEA
jgi:hypothetical protein